MSRRAPRCRCRPARHVAHRRHDLDELNDGSRVARSGLHGPAGRRRRGGEPAGGTVGDTAARRRADTRGTAGTAAQARSPSPACETPSRTLIAEIDRRLSAQINADPACAGVPGTGGHLARPRHAGARRRPGTRREGPRPQHQQARAGPHDCASSAARPGIRARSSCRSMRRNSASSAASPTA